jgi:hypothetical protein
MLNRQTLLILLGGVLLILGALLIWIFQKRQADDPASSDSALSWLSYVKGQGTVLLTFIALGAFFGWFGMRRTGDVEITRTSTITEFRQVAIAENPVLKQVDTAGYHHLCIYAKALAPSSKFTVRIIPDGEMSKPTSVTFDVTDSSWTRVEKDVLSARTTLVIERAATNTNTPAEVDIIIALEKR